MFKLIEVLCFVGLSLGNIDLVSEFGEFRLSMPNAGFVGRLSLT